jgi:hypothetical protein
MTMKMVKDMDPMLIIPMMSMLGVKARRNRMIRVNGIATH